MATVIVTLKIMPSGPDKDLELLRKEVEKLIIDFVDEKHKDSEIRAEEEPIGFGIKALKLTFAYDESLGTTDKLEENISQRDDVESVEAVDVRRAIG